MRDESRSLITDILEIFPSLISRIQSAKIQRCVFYSLFKLLSDSLIFSFKVRIANFGYNRELVKEA